MNSGRFRSPAARTVAAGAVAALLGFGATACGSGGTEFSDVAQRGKRTATSSGCASCHGANGQGGVGPAWIDLHGSERVLTDGSTVVADDEYLLRSILEPQVEEVDGFTLRMPVNGLSEAEARDVIAYIKELTSDE